MCVQYVLICVWIDFISGCEYSNLVCEVEENYELQVIDTRVATCTRTCKLDVSQEKCDMKVFFEVECEPNTSDFSNIKEHRRIIFF